MEEKKRKKLTMGPNNARCVFGPFLLSSPSLPFKIPIVPTYIVVVSIQSQLNTKEKEKEKNLQMLVVEGEEQEEQGT